MAKSRNILIYLMTASVSLLTVTGQKGPPTKSTDGDGPDNQHHDPDKTRNGIIGGAVFVVLLLILVVVLILVRYKFPRIKEYCAAGVSSEQSTNAGQNGEGNHADRGDEEEIQTQTQQAVPYVCANVKPPSNQVHYATVNFQKDSVGVSTDGSTLPDVNKNAPEQALYSTVKMPEKP